MDKAVYEELIEEEKGRGGGIGWGFIYDSISEGQLDWQDGSRSS
jgi:hypothetical protein